MPPKVRARPAARLAGRARAKAAPKVKAAALPVRKRVAKKRPAARDGEEKGDQRGDKDISELFESGHPVKALDLPLQLWKSGTRVVSEDCTYWDEDTRLAGVIKGFESEGDQTKVKLALEGTRSEALLRWAGQNPRRHLELHLCRADCPRLCKDGL